MRAFSRVEIEFDPKLDTYRALLNSLTAGGSTSILTPSLSRFFRKVLLLMVAPSSPSPSEYAKTKSEKDFSQIQREMEAQNLDINIFCFVTPGYGEIKKIGGI